jgi:hypothetical protein
MDVATLPEFLDEQYGKRGTKKRKEYELGFEAFRIGVMLQLAREQKKGLTRKEVNELIGLMKSFTKKIETDLKDIKFSTLQWIIREGLAA